MGAALAFSGLGCLAMISVTAQPIALGMYLLAFTLVLAFTNVLEGVSMSLLSKVIHPELAKGTFNAGALLLGPCTVTTASHANRLWLGTVTMAQHTNRLWLGAVTMP